MSAAAASCNFQCSLDSFSYTLEVVAHKKPLLPPAAHCIRLLNIKEENQPILSAARLVDRFPPEANPCRHPVSSLTCTSSPQQVNRSPRGKISRLPDQHSKINVVFLSPYAGAQLCLDFLLHTILVSCFPAVDTSHSTPRP